MMFSTTTMLLADNGVNINHGLCLQPGAGKNYGQQCRVSYNRIHDKADASFRMQKADLLHSPGCDGFVGS